MDVTTASSGNSVPGARLLTLGVLVTFVSVYALGTYSGLLEGEALLWWSDMAWTISSLAAGLRCIKTARGLRRRNERRAWYAFAVAALCWFGGMLVWDYMELFEGVVTPFPSTADFFFVGFGVAFVAGIFFYRDARYARYVNWIQVGNLGIIICTVVIVTTVILYPQIRQSKESVLFIAFAIAYPVVFMSGSVFGLFSYWFYVWTSSRRVFPLIVFALFIHAVTDTLYAFELLGRTYWAGNYLNVCWVVAFAVQYWAAVEQDFLSRQGADDTEPVEKTMRVEEFEGVAPSLSIGLILLVLWVFGRDVDDHFMKFIFFMALCLMAFMVVREWSMTRSLVHARGHLEEKVQQRTRELLQANRELEAYSYSIAHDLRSPLRAVTGFSQILKEEAGGKLDDEEKRLLGRIAEAGHSMATLIDEILDLARINRVEMKWEKVDLSELCRTTLGKHVETAGDRQIDCRIQPGIFVRGDPQLIALVIENLIGNAVKYTSNQPRARIEVGATKEGEKTVFYVRDNGSGFDMRHYDKLFEPFQRLHAQDEFPGSGVGLAIVQRIVERHDGQIRAQSAPGEGATFFVMLP